MIVAVRIDHFAAAVEREAQGLAEDLPVVLARGTLVGAACALAAAAGVQPGQTLRHARALCPTARIYPLAPGRSREVADDLAELLATFSGRVELDGCGETGGAAVWFLDLGTVDAVAALDLARRLEQALAGRVPAPARLGIAGSRFTARCAALEAIAAPRYVAAGQEAAFLAPLPVGYLPLDREMGERLELLGLRRIGQIAALPASALLSQFGAVGRLLHTLARGRDVDPVQPYIPAATLGLRRRFDGAVADQGALQLALASLGSRLSARLVRRGCAARAVRLHLEQAEHPAWSDTLVLSMPTTQPEPLQRALLTLLARARLQSGVEHVTAGCADLKPQVVTQLDLFGTGATGARQELVGNLVARFGARRFFAAVPGQRDARLPERRYELLEARRR